MATFAKGDIVLFPFPYTDLSARKLRPCLVLSAEMGEDILLCQITSQQLQKDNHSFELRSKDTVDGTLHIDSYIRTNMIFTASKAQIRRRLGMIKNDVYAQVVNRVIHLITK